MQRRKTNAALTTFNPYPNENLSSHNDFLHQPTFHLPVKLSKMNNYNDVQDHVEQLIEDGYIKQDGEPCKCQKCGGTDFYDKGHTTHLRKGIPVPEFSRNCISCNTQVGYRDGGNWRAIYV